MIVIAPKPTAHQRLRDIDVGAQSPSRVIEPATLNGAATSAQPYDAAAFQRQRMEALGQCMGGVAHDFNNLLTPIIGSLDLLRCWARDQPSPLRQVERAIASAERARVMVGRLLSYSRVQPPAPADLEVPALFEGLCDLIRSSLTSAVAIACDMAPSLPLVRADKAELELAILNLVLNARDAMPDGGTLTISAHSANSSRLAGLPIGRYVAISLADNGCGMDAATLCRASEPFFTTKPEGKGTGLGLAMVYSFASGSGGRLLLDSTPGIGTTATILLPEASIGDQARLGPLPRAA